MTDDIEAIEAISRAKRLKQFEEYQNYLNQLEQLEEVDTSQPVGDLEGRTMKKMAPASSSVSDIFKRSMRENA